jgi:Ca2+-binding RTX toxin-like protein
MPVPTILTPAFKVFTSNNVESQPSVFASADGRFGVFWSAAVGSENDVRGYVYAGGAIGSDGIGRVNPTDVQGVATSASEVNPSADFNLQSNVVFAYEKVVNGERDIYFNSRSRLADGSYLTTISSELVNSSATAGGQFQPKIAATPVSGFAIAWEDANTTRVNVQVYGPGGFKTGAINSFVANANQMVDSNEIDIFASFDGDFIVSYIGEYNFGPRSCFSVVTTLGSATYQNVFVSSNYTTTASYNVAVARNNVGVSCFAFNEGTDTVIRTFGQLYLPITSNVVLSNASNTGESPRVTALLDGRFLVIYSSTGSGPLVGQIVGVTGILDGNSFVISPTGYQGDLETLADGRVMISWREGGTGNGDIYAAIYDPREAGVELFGTGTDDNYVGSNFADTIEGAGGKDTILAGQGNDVVRAGSGADLVYGGTGNNTIDGGADADIIVGGSGNELLQGGGGPARDTIYGEGGDDRIYAATLAAPALANAQGVLVGGAGNDSLYGSVGADYLYGGADDDSLEGGGGIDVLIGESGSDTMRGGDGNDVFYSGVGTNSMFGDAGDDVFLSEGSADFIEGGSDHNYYYRYAAGSVQITGGAGIDEFVGGVAASNDTFTGGDGQDYAYGGNGDDLLKGNTGDDVLIGQGGNDTLEGGAGVNLLWANDAGNDQVLVNVADGGTQVLEFFEAGGTNDVVRLLGSSLTSFSGIEALRTGIGSVIGGNLLVNAGSGAQLYLNVGANQTAIWFQGVSAYSLTSADFLFG